MRYGIVSDIHANIQAWKAVLRDMEKEGVDMILCLGDVIGYGPNPAEVLDSCYANIDHFLLGNHDAVIGNRLDSSLFNDNAKYLIEWTRDQLNDAAADFFGDMPLQMEGEGFVCAHGELALPGRFGYIYEANDAIESFTSNESPLMFVGHTHLPAKIALDLNRNQVLNQTAVDGFLLPHERYMINVGSVGDPRDGETTASYCIFDQEKNFIKFRKVQFNVEAFRKNLLKAQLPVTPFFLKVYDGMKSETQTIKDMEVMEANQAIESKKATQKISNVPSDIKKRRTKVTFSMDTVEQTRQYKAREQSRREIEATHKKKGGTVIIALVAGLILVFIIIILAVKSNSGPNTTDPNDLVNKPENTKKVTSVMQEVSGDFLLTADEANISEEVEIADGVINWVDSSEEIEWTLSVKKTGYFRILMTAKKEGDTNIKLTAAGSTLNPTLKSDKGTTVQDLGWFFIEKKVNTKLKLSSSSDPNTKIKSLKLKFLGQEKPNPFGNLDDVEFAKFESQLYPAGWNIDGPAFNSTPVSARTLIYGAELKGTDGNFAVASLSKLAPDINAAKEMRGSLISPDFEIKHSYINMLGHGSGDFTTQVILRNLKDEEIIKMPIPSGSGSMKSFSFDVREYIGSKAKLEFKDNSSSNYLAIDRINFTNKKDNEFSEGDGNIKGEFKHPDIELTANKIFNEAGRKLLALDLKEAVSELEKISELPEAVAREYFRTVKTINSPFNVDSIESASGNSLTAVAPGQFLIKKTSEKNEDTYKLSGTFQQSTFKILKIKSIDHIKLGGTAGTGEGGSFDTPVFKMKILKQAPVKGRYLRISKGSPSLNLIEVEVMSGGKNVAAKKTCTQSTRWRNAKAEFAVDGRKNTDFRKGDGSATDDNSSNPWWMVDLGKEYPIEQIKVWNRTDGNYGKRLDKTTYIILDGAKRITWRQWINKAEKILDIPVTSEFYVKFNKDLAAQATGASLGSTFPFNSEWQYYEASENPGKDWLKNDYDDSQWKKGKGAFGYGKKPVTNLNIKNKNICFYLRKKFVLKNPSTDLKLNCVFDDGFAVFINGQGAAKVNIKDISHKSKASKRISGPDKTSITLKKEHLKTGENLISVLVKNQSLNSSDIHFDAELISSESKSTPVIKTPTVNSINSVLVSKFPIAVKGDKFEITMEFPNKEKANLLGSFRLSTKKEVASGGLEQYIESIKALPTAKEKIVESYRNDIGKEIQLTLKTKKEEKTVAVTVRDVNDKKITVIYNGKANPIPYKIISEKDIKARLMRFPDGDLIFRYFKQTLKSDLGSMTFDKNTPLQELFSAGKKGLPESVKYGIYGRYVEIWEFSEKSTATWTLKVKGSGNEIKVNPVKSPLTSLYPKVEKFPFHVYLHDLGKDMNIDTVQFENIKGEMIVMNAVIRDSNGKIIWQKKDVDFLTVKSGFKELKLNKSYLTPPYENLALHKQYTETSKSYLKGLNDGVVSILNPFFYTTGKEEEFPKDVVIDLGSEKEFNTFYFTKMDRGSTRLLTFSVSTDNKEFKEVGKHIFDINKKVTLHSKSFERVSARYIKISFRNVKKTNKIDNYYQSLLAEFEVYNIPD